MRAALITVALCACAGVLNAQNQLGTIIFYREPHFTGGSFKPFLFCDGIQLTKIESGSYVRVQAPEGTHHCTMETPERPVTEIHVTAGDTTYVRIEVQSGFKDHAFLANTTEDDYRRQTPKLHSAGEWSLDAVPSQSQTANSVHPVAPPSPRLKTEVSGRFGDLALRVSKIVLTPSKYQRDRTTLETFLTATNTGKGVICADLNAALNTSFGLQYHGYSQNAPRMHEMLPGESNEGSYIFDIKEGVQPLELVFRLGLSESIRCGSDTPWHDITIRNEMRLDIHDLPVTQAAPAQ